MNTKGVIKGVLIKTVNLVTDGYCEFCDGLGKVVDRILLRLRQCPHCEGMRYAKQKEADPDTE